MFPDAPLNFDAMRFEVLNGPTYTQANRPPFWRNETPLQIIGNPLNLKHPSIPDFPLIEDFEIRLERLLTPDAPFGYHIHFFSPKRGYVAGFPWWDHTEQHLIRDNFKIPLGDSQHPYDDVEQGWAIIIAAQDRLLYVLQGENENYSADGYYAWFKVNLDVYLAEWQKAIALCKKTFQKQT